MIYRSARQGVCGQLKDNLLGKLKLQQMEKTEMDLSDEQLIIAIQKSMVNAGELLADANLLHENDRLPRAYTLYQLAMEETGKALRIYGSIILGKLDTEQGRKEFKRDFTDHIEKAQSARAMMLIVIDSIRRTSPELAMKLYDWTFAEYTDSKTLNDYKNYSLYTSWVDGAYKTPSEVITKDRINYIELMANARFKAARAFTDASIDNIKEVKKYAKQHPPNDESMEKWIANLFGAENHPEKE
jgi:AbiV family abortive infection protein